MMNRKAHLRLICLLLTLTMVFSVAPPAYASPQTDKAAEAHVPEVQTDPEEHAPDELVRVTIELDRASTLDAGYSTDRVAPRFWPASASAWEACFSWLWMTR